MFQKIGPVQTVMSAVYFMGAHPVARRYVDAAVSSTGAACIRRNELQRFARRVVAVSSFHFKLGGTPVSGTRNELHADMPG